MKVIADLQIHSRFARATSKDITLDNLEKGARLKGLTLIGTGDFQHPLWRKEIDAHLKEDDQGILWSKNGFPFLWQTEVSLMFSQGGKRRAVHVLIFAPNTAVADKITAFLASKGRLDYDGRPIFGMTCIELVKQLKEIDDWIEIIPAHCMTPWFGLFGSDSGFDSVEECFGNQTKHIYAIESGMSADPEMLWRMKQNVTVVSFSDAHSHHPWRIGREATIFEIGKLSYRELVKAIRTGNGLVGTIETPAEYGKYHWDGHRACNFSCSPAETRKLNGICPVCKKLLTIGVEYRIEHLAKEKPGYKPSNSKLFYRIVPLHELLAFHLEVSMTSKKVKTFYDELMKSFDSEFSLLLEASKEEMISKKVNPKLIDLLLMHRKGTLKFKPGYDGVYGQIVVPDKQGKLF